MESNQNNRPETKQLLLAGATLISLVANWFLIKIALYQGESLTFWIWPAFAIIISVCLLSFLSLVRPNRFIALGVHTLSLVAYLLIMPKDFYVILGGAVFYICSLLFAGWIAKEGENLLSFSISSTIGRTQSLITYGFLLLLGLNIYYNTSQDFKQNPSVFYERLSDSVARGIPFFSETIGGKTDPNQSLDQYLLTQTMDSQGRPLEDLRGPQRTFLLDEARNQFSRQFGIDTSGSEKMSEVVSKIVTDRTRPVLERYGKYFPIIFTLIILALLRTFAFVFNWLTLLFAWLMYRLLLSLRFFRLEKVAIEVQKLRL